MSSEQQPTKMIKSSNIGFVFGILLVVALGMYLFKSGFMADKFSLNKKIEPTPTPTAIVEIEDEPITLLDDQNERVFDLTEEDEVEEVEEVKVVTHEPVDTAIGDNPIFLITMLLIGAGATLYTSKKLA